MVHLQVGAVVGEQQMAGDDVVGQQAIPEDAVVALETVVGQPQHLAAVVATPLHAIGIQTGLLLDQHCGAGGGLAVDGAGDIAVDGVTHRAHGAVHRSRGQSVAYGFRRIEVHIASAEKAGSSRVVGVGINRRAFLGRVAIDAEFVGT